MFKRVLLIVGMPRSGTSWLGQILDSSPQVAFRLSPLFSYALKNVVGEGSSPSEFQDMFARAYAARDDEFMNQSERRKTGHYPIFRDKWNDPDTLVIKDTRYHNLLPRMLHVIDDLEVVAIVRHPCGVIHSWLTNPGEFPAGADPATEWRTGACRKTGPEEFWGFNDWKIVTRLHLDLRARFPDRFYMVQYERLLQEPLREVTAIFKFAHLQLTRQTEDFLIASQSIHDPDPYAVFKDPSRQERWRDELSPDIRNTIIREVEHTELSQFLT